MSHLYELANLAIKTEESCYNNVDKAAWIIANALARGNKLLVCGNGGSAADAGHFSAEFVGRYMTERTPLAAMDLSSLPAITAIGNDYGFEFIFSRQIEALGNPGDVLVLISTSGMSANLIEAVKAARDGNLRTITLTGYAAHDYLADAEVWLRVPSSHTAHIQEIEIALLHSICEKVEEILEGT